MINHEHIIGSINTPTTLVEVHDSVWPAPTEHTWTLSKPAVSLCLFPPGYLAEARYAATRSKRMNRIGRVSFVPADMELLGRGSGGAFRHVRCSFNLAYYERTVGGCIKLTQQQLFSSLNIQSVLLPTLLMRLMMETLQPGFVASSVVEALGQAILIEHAHMLHSPDVSECKPGTLLPRHIRIIEEYVESCSGKSPSVHEIAHSCGFSERYFAKLFREYYGHTISQYLKSIQLKRAQEYLVGTDLPLKEIAFRLGFSNPSNFSSAFHSAMGTTPGAFRTCRR